MGVVLFLFIVGLEMEPSRLWSLRKQIFGLGVIQVALCGALLTGAGILLRLRAGGGVHRRHGVRADLDRDRHATADRARRPRNARRPEDRLDPAARRSCHRAAAGDRRADLAAGRSSAATATPVWISILVAIGCVAALQLIGRWVLNPLFRILANAQAREVMTGRGAARRAGGGAALPVRRAQHGDGRVPRRRAALDLDLPASARGRHRAVPRHPARPVLPRRRHVARPQRRGRATGRSSRSAWSATWRSRAARSSFWRASLKSSIADALERALLMAQGGEFAFVLFTTAAASGLISAGPAGDLFGDGDHLDGADAADHSQRSSCCRAQAQSMDGRRGARRAQRRRADHRLRPLRPDRGAGAARQGPQDFADRHRHRHDPRRRPVRRARSITATARGSTSCVRPASRRSIWW